jgi:hypothetical protein
LKKKGKVVWGDTIRRMSGHPELGISSLDKIANESDVIQVSDLNKQLEEPISKFGYIYQPFDPAMDSVSGIAWEFKIDKFIKKSAEHRTVKSFKANYNLPAELMGAGECKKCWRGRERSDQDEWSVILSGMRMLKVPIRPDNQKEFGFKVKKDFFYKSDYKHILSWGRGPAWVHLERGKGWPNEYTNEKRLSRQSVVTQEILNTHIHESLIHEILKVLFVNAGWYMNYEMPVKYKENGKKRRGRIDFLIKQSNDIPWQVVEVKLADNPDAIRQLANYLRGLRDEIRKIKDCGDSNFCLLAGTRKGTVKKLEGIILCPKEAKHEIIEEVKKQKRKFKVWMYSLDIPKKLTISFKVWDETSHQILSSEEVNHRG